MKMTGGTRRNKEYNRLMQQRSREKRRKQIDYLISSNESMEKQVSLLEYKKNRLQDTLCFLVNEQKTRQKRKRTRENEAEYKILKEEYEYLRSSVFRYRELRKGVLSFCSSFFNHERSVEKGLLFLENKSYILLNSLDLAYRTMGGTLHMFDSRTILQSIEKALIGFPSFKEVLSKKEIEKSSAFSSKLEFFNFEVRSHLDESNESWVRVDLFDIPISPEKFLKLGSWFKNSQMLSEVYFSNKDMKNEVNRWDENSLTFKRAETFDLSNGFSKLNISSQNVDEKEMYALNFIEQKKLNSSVFPNHQAVLETDEELDVIVFSAYIVASLGANLKKVETSSSSFFQETYYLREGNQKGTSSFTAVIRANVSPKLSTSTSATEERKAFRTLKKHVDPLTHLARIVMFANIAKGIELKNDFAH